MHEKVVGGLDATFAKGAKTTIRPSALGQTVGRPNPILVNKPNEKLDLGRGPILPNRLVES